MEQSNKKVIVTGASGLIGRYLSRYLYNAGYSIITVGRNPEKTSQLLPFAEKNFSWKQLEEGDIDAYINNAAAVINLAGASIGGKRWTQEYKKFILNSRIEATEKITAAIERGAKPSVLINSSATGFYGNRGDEKLDETSAAGMGLLAEVTKRWEEAALKAEKHTRVALGRKGFVLAADAPAFKKLIFPFKLFAGGPLGSGQQWMPWIHIEDVCRMYEFIIINGNISGPVNFVAPETLRNTEFMQITAAVLRRPAAVKTPAFALKLLLGEMSELLLDSQRVIPEKITDKGFHFKYEKLSETLESILR